MRVVGTLVELGDDTFVFLADLVGAKLSPNELEAEPPGKEGMLAMKLMSQYSTFEPPCVGETRHSDSSNDHCNNTDIALRTLQVLTYHVHNSRFHMKTCTIDKVVPQPSNI